MKQPRLYIAATGAANLASVRAMCARAGVEAVVTDDADLLYRAERALLPGVGAFGAAMARLKPAGLDKALSARIDEGLPTMGICLGMQMLCLSSGESEGVPGIGAIPCVVEKFEGGLPLPQLGWNRIKPAPVDGFLKPGWAYFANSYRIAAAPAGYLSATGFYGEEFAATIEGRFDETTGVPRILLCQFHPELSGAWGLDLFSRWMGLDEPRFMKGQDNGKGAAGKKTGLAAGRGTAVRIIPCLDIKGGRVVKGVRFENLVDSGDPAELAARYEEEGADEIALLDISATLEERRTALEAVAAVRRRISIPISVGGGIRSVEDAERLLNAGADRISVNSAAARNPGLVSALAERFGVQCVIAAIDAARRDPDPAGSGKPGEKSAGAGGSDHEDSWEVFIEAGKTATGLDAVDWARRCASLGAGEILLTSIDRDGTGLGYDGELVAAIAKAAGIPVIASGGATKPEHFLEGVRAGASALLGAGAFHRKELSIADLKRFLLKFGVEVRI